MVTIDLNNNKFKVSGNMRVINKVYERMKVKHPNAYYLRPHMEKSWDGKIKYLTDSGYARSGLLPMVTSILEEFNEEYTIKDNRKLLETNEIPIKIGDFKARDYQIEAVESIVYNEVGDIPYPRGVIAAATNAGKTLIAAMLFKSFKGAKALILLNNTDLYRQFMDDMPKFFGKDWGYMQGKNLKWGPIMICMTPTLIKRMDVYRLELARYNMVLFDECHLLPSKTNKKVVEKLFNTYVRVGLSGTPFKHNDKTKNMDVRAFFGEQVFAIKNIELMDMDYSTPIVVKIIKGNTTVKVKGDYNEEYRLGITENRERERASIERAKFYIKRDQYPILIIGKYHDHVERLYEAYQKEFGDIYRVAFIHHKVKDRTKILNKFKRGDIDILISSLIVKLGQNIPLIKYMQNASGGDTDITTLQLVGRAIRKHNSKAKVYYEDFYDIGAYLMRHSKHRIKCYRDEGFKIIELYKKK